MFFLQGAVAGAVLVAMVMCDRVLCCGLSIAWLRAPDLFCCNFG